MSVITSFLPPPLYDPTVHRRRRVQQLKFFTWILFSKWNLSARHIETRLIVCLLLKVFGRLACREIVKDLFGTELLVLQFVPILICCADIICSTCFETIGRFTTIIKIQFAVDDFKRLWVHTGNLAGSCDTSCSVTAILRRISLRVFYKKISIFVAEKVPFGFVPFV